jgi:hypothetical protein
MKVKDRWTTYLEVDGTPSANSGFFKDENRSNILKLISQKNSPEEAVAPFTKKHFLMDPLMTSGIQASQFGRPKKLKSSGGFLGFSKIIDKRKAYSLNGGAYEKIWNELKLKIQDHLKKLKKESAQKSFVYEPELISTDNKDCFDGVPCKDFDTFLNQLTDQVFIYWLAYSTYNTGSLKDFFTEDNLRFKLFNRIEADVINMKTYYDALITRREAQINCLNTLINGKDGLWDQGILSNSSNGLMEGGNYYNNPSQNPDPLNNGRKTVSGRTQITRAQFDFDLLSGSLRSMGESAKVDSMGAQSAQSSGQGSVNSSGASLLAVRANQIKKINDQSLKLGESVSSREKSVEDSIKKLGLISGQGQGGLSSTTGLKPSDSSSFKGQGSSSENLNQKSGGLSTRDSLSEDSLDSTDALGKGNASSKDFSLSGINSSADHQDHLSQGQNSGKNMTDDETQKLLLEADKQKNELQESSDDELFQKVSKAYLRNLDKILKRKKIEE